MSDNDTRLRDLVLARIAADLRDDGLEVPVNGPVSYTAPHPIVTDFCQWTCRPLATGITFHFDQQRPSAAHVKYVRAGKEVVHINRFQKAPTLVPGGERRQRFTSVANDRRQRVALVEP